MILAVINIMMWSCIISVPVLTSRLQASIKTTSLWQPCHI